MMMSLRSFLFSHMCVYSVSILLFPWHATCERRQARCSRAEACCCPDRGKNNSWTRHKHDQNMMGEIQSHVKIDAATEKERWFVSVDARCFFNTIFETVENSHARIECVEKVSCGIAQWGTQRNEWRREEKREIVMAPPSLSSYFIHFNVSCAHQIVFHAVSPGNFVFDFRKMKTMTKYVALPHRWPSISNCAQIQEFVVERLKWNEHVALPERRERERVWMDSSYLSFPQFLYLPLKWDLLVLCEKWRRESTRQVNSVENE